ncbi:hypothetical protein F0L74_01005 [Chitinophaga agrisoli]|uniref:AraC effector-binding domain-containing protein n=1 Tax=Chitinophaga agrisoli TaxID=2607653 RepID=A0A5B2VZU8_9BACT|nr:DJ-1/PfpI family protein [Chitinophaga agrisoli]KAA2244585.1 hypothetical protein F0L74_01005 [Chitinophaga agrisoli]
MQPAKNCYLYVFDGYADWEPALTVYGLSNFTKTEVITFSLDGQPVTSGGNVVVQPAKSLADLDPAVIDFLLLPGGASMKNGKHQALLPLLKQHVQAQKPLAAICDATVFLAHHGFLDQVQHTSNDLQLLKRLVPDYKAENRYVKAPVITDGHIITAAGTSMVEFAQAIYKEMQLDTNEQLAFWLQFFLKGTAPELEQVAPFHFFYRSYRIKLAGIPALVRNVAREIVSAAVANDLELAGPQHWHYYGFTGDPEQEFTLEIGVPVITPKTVRPPYACKTAPGFTCVSTLHRGDWQQLGKTYEQLINGLLLTGMQMSGHNREQYIHCDFENTAANLTRIQVGIKNV